jgi:hypothetical protein
MSEGVEDLEVCLQDTYTQDMEAVKEFYLGHPDPNILLHLKDHLAAVEDGLHFVITHQSKIVGGAVITPVPGTDYYEAGNTRIIEPAQGYGLQQLLFEIRAAALARALPTKVMVTGVDPEKNKRSLSNIKAVAEFEPWPQPHAALRGLCTECEKRKGLPAERQCCCDFFLMPPSGQRKVVARFLSRIENATRYSAEPLRRTHDLPSPTIYFQKRPNRPGIFVQIVSRLAANSLRRQELADYAAGRRP